MPNPLPAHIRMVVTDPTHPRAGQEGTLVDVPEEFVRQVMDRTRSARLKGRPFRIDVDRGPGDRA